MHRSTGLAIAVACAFCAAVGVSAQDDALPAGFRILRGVVVHDEPSRLPVRRARVSVTWTDGRSEVFTDDRGGFELRVRASGGYTLDVSKPGYAPLKEFQERSSGPIEVRLPRGAVITGTVVDPSGAPGVGVGVVLRRTDASGTAYSAGEYLTDTDDRGEFRVGSLPAGPYAVVISGPSVISCPSYLASSCPGVQVRAGWVSGIVLNAPVKPETLVRTSAGEEVSVGRVYEPPPLTNEVEFFVKGFNDGLQAASGAGGSTIGRSAAISGRVLDVLSRPVARAIVRAFPLEGGPGPTASTDSRGRFELRGLAAGTYRLVARPAQSGLGIPVDTRSLTVTVSDGGRATGIDVLVPSGSVISGKVVDEHGEPLEGLTVQAWQSRWREGRTVLEPVTNVAPRKTDDRGHYRLFGLSPGSYYPVIARASEGPATPDGGMLDTYASMSDFWLVLYPGVLAVGEAQSVDVDEGRSALGVDIRVPSSRLGHVRGRVVNSSGEPSTGLVVLASSSRGGLPVAQSRTLRVSDGIFDFSEVPPGEYVIRALVNGTRESPDPPRPVEDGSAEFGISFVTVLDHDVGDIAIRTAPGTSVKGRMVVEGEPSAPLPAAASLAALSADPDFTIAPRPRAGSASADGAFQIVGLTGPVRFALATPVPGWRVASIYIDGINAAEEPVTFGRGEPSRTDVEVVLTKDDAEISGRVAGAQAARGGAAVLLFPPDQRRWFDRSPFLRLTTTDRDGRFTAGRMPPGEYLVVAIDVNQIGTGDEWRNPDLLSRLAPNGRRVRVGKSGRATVELNAIAR